MPRGTPLCSKHAKMICEVHYSQSTRHFEDEKMVVVLQKHYYWVKPR